MQRNQQIVFKLLHNRNPLFKLKYLLFFLLAMTFLSCKNNDKNKPIKAEVKPEVKTSSFSPNGIDQENIRQLVENVDHIEFMFNDIGVSMNQDGRQAIYQDLQNLSAETISVIPPNCKPLLRKIYLVEGKILMEADVYHGNECFFQIFIKDRKKLFGNKITAAGIESMNLLLANIEKSSSGGSSSH